ncbi:MAG: aminotransferase class III-fold pyridoxal phosphate-dependent enzyme [Chthonomonadales bacterium]|nr:aminotransferase class III-fold pyridoxal phosphate-dependent enzyme [Chthonomonadales bacterium]
MTPEDRIEEVISKYQRYVNPGLASLMKFGGFGDVEVSASGCIVRTASGSEYLDCLGGYGVFTLGHSHPDVVQAVRRQLEVMPLSSRTFFQEPLANLAEKLAQVAPGDLQYSFLCNSGTEAVEGALKIARVATGRTRFVCTVGGFHGKSMGSLSATGREVFRKPFDPLVPGFVHVPFDDVAAVEEHVDAETAGVVVEPIQGEGGIRCPHPDYLPRLREICNSRGALLILDEVQTGLARTGAMFACYHWNVVPDIMTLAKALGGGVMPIGAVMSTAPIWQAAFDENPLLHTSTFGGNPLACAAGLATLHVIERDGLVERAQTRGNQLLDGLRQVQARFPDALAEVRGMGLMVGVEFKIKDVAELSINGMARRGVIAAYTLNNPYVMRFEPPVIITEEQVNQAVNAFGEAVEEAVAMLADV